MSAGGCLPRGMYTSPLWTEFLTHTCENITFPQLSLRTVKTIDGQDVCSFKFAHCKKGLAVVTFVVDVDEKKEENLTRYSFIAVLGTG